MTISIRELDPRERDRAVPLLLLAEESAPALRWSLANLSDTVYLLEDDGVAVGAATVRWNRTPYEIMELAIAPERQGQGLGKELVSFLVEEARRRGKDTLLVGTANSSIGNIAFYQKCGFRMDHVRPDYFWYYQEPLVINGIRTQDMLVFRYDLADRAPSAPA